MRSETERGKLFTRRAVVLGAGKLTLVSALASRLFYLQVYRSDEYKTLSEDNRVNLQLITPPRGRILDRYGDKIADNGINYQLAVTQEEAKNLDELLSRVQNLLNISDEEMNEALHKMKKSNRFAPTVIRDYLNWEDVAKIEILGHELPGIHIHTGHLRFYPYGKSTAHVTGYIGHATEKEASNDKVLRLPDFKIGKNGIEKQYDENMRGSVGVKKLEVDAHGKIVRELEKKESVKGDDIELSIDMRLQKFVVDRMGEETGAVVVMDVHSGEVYAMASMPGYDPNILSEKITREYWKELSDDKTKPLIQKAIAGQYPPGSTFKMMVGLAGLEAGSVTPASSFFCPGHLDFGGHRFHCWKRGGHGTVDLNRAIAESCDVYFYQVAHKVGINKIADMCRRFGLGERTGIDLPHEKGGLIPDTAWKLKRFKLSWLPGETLNVGIGQGYVLTTPLQLALMTARIANGGKDVKPTLLKKTPTEYEAAASSLKPVGIDQTHLQHIQDGMFTVSNVPGGTAYAKRITEPGFELAGKTGTAQVKKILRGANSKSLKETRREFKHHAWFVAYAPVQKPKYAICVLIEHGESGSGAAAPVARDIMYAAQKLDLSSETKTDYIPVLPQEKPADPPPAATPEPTAEPAPEPATEEINDAPRIE